MDSQRHECDVAVQPEIFAQARLRRCSYTALRNISCVCEDGVLVLQGCVETYYLKQIAQAAVASTRGISRIENRIQVLQGAPRRE